MQALSFAGSKLTDKCTPDVKNRDCLLFDDKENPIALDNQVSDRNIQLFTLRCKRATERH